MSTKLKAGTATTGAVLDADTTGILELQSGSTPTTAITVDASQNVGIGTASPAQRLDVQAAACVSKLTSTTGTNAVFTQMVNTGGSFFLGTDDSTGATSGAAYGRFVYGTGAYPMIFFTNSAERMRITSGGNLLVGTTNNNANDRGAATRAVISSPTSGGGDTLGLLQVTNTSFNIASLVNTTSGTRYHVGFGDGTTWAERGTISTNGTGTTYSTTSDYRLKENVEPMSGGLAKVSALKPVTYKWKETGTTGQGFIAHELAEICPDAVVGEKDGVKEDGTPQYQQIDTSFLVATLVSAIKEQQAMIEELKNKVTALEAK